ncbi:hypothetical protein ACIQXF_20055 [Lysinibacillus sp. NPDC097231]|uniref:hypothetical protein n=1 Tax=Lysinibacillus sp. NPDC097231 TaxID=3364142 RepID=UPI0038228522
MDKYVCLSLNQYFNNIGTTNSSNFLRGELSLGESSLPQENIPFGTPFIFEGTPFLLSKNTDLSDNIQMENQQIRLKDIPRIKKLHFLGVSNNGDLYEEIHFLKNNKNVYSDFLKLSDFTSSDSFFDDKRALQFEYMYTRKGINTSYKPSMWYNYIKFPHPIPIDEIVFEDNPFIHIFAITLERGE